MKVELLVIHCTATPEGRDVTGDDVRHWHTDPIEKGGRGWRQVGYRHLIRFNGVETLVPDNGDENIDANEITNGAFGVNAKSIHICYVGGMDRARKFGKDTRTSLQKTLMKKIVIDYIQKFPWIKVCGHYKVNQTNCPDFPVESWLKEIGVESKNIL